MAKRRRCQAAVYKKDTLRRTGRGKSGFEMHYRKCQCERAAVDGGDFCRQHATEGWRLRAVYHEYMKDDPTA